MKKTQKQQRSVVNKRKEKLKKEKKALEELDSRIAELDPKAALEYTQFKELPISDITLKGLTDAGFISMTDIQKQTLPATLKGKDLLGAARTGSGKTLAFLVPVLEKLHRLSWNEYDGLGALIISPTRELAAQIYEVLVKIGKQNSLSAGLVIGGKDVKFEKSRIAKMNILVGTPGRILQHMDQSAGFDVSNLQVLVLDEADRILDMGFKKVLDSIIENLSPQRQTLLFSATQTKSVSDLARLSLVNPEYVNTEPEVEKSTPQSLEESYTVVALPEKLDLLWSFLKSHLKSKIIVFFSSSKQVQFVYETFRKLQPGISLHKLVGKQKQTSRIETTYKFTKANHVCLLATDIVARGLDFPSVDWVVQVDCPEDVDTYIHRVGRSARFGKSGKSLLLLLPSEKDAFLAKLAAKKIEPKQLTVKSSKKTSIQSKLQALCFQNPELKYLGQKSFISYFRSVYLQKDKETFDVAQLPGEEYAKSLGLPGAPKIKFKGGQANKELKNASRQLLKLSEANEDGEIVEKKVKTKYDRMFERKNQNVLSEHYMSITKENEAVSGDEDEDDFMTIKRQDHTLQEDELPDLSIPVSRRQAKKGLSRKASLAAHGNATKVKFDDDGVAHPVYELEDEEGFLKDGAPREQIEKFIAKESETMAQRDLDDKEVARQKRMEKKRRRKEIERAREAGSDADSDAEEVQVVLGNGGGYSGAEGGYSGSSDSSDSSDSESEDERPAKRQNVGVVEYEEPETLEDLEALTAQLIG